MKYAWKNDGKGNSLYVHVGAEAGEGETQGYMEWTVDGIHGMDSEGYSVVNNVLTIKSQHEFDSIVLSRNENAILAINSAKAKKEQDKIIEAHAINTAKKALGLVVVEADISELQTYVQVLEGDIQNPSSDQAYHPPLPPGVVASDVAAIIATITRLSGWNAVLGWRIDFDISDPEYIPANIAISVYSSPDCSGYLYTPGALQVDAETGKYYALCPAGQEHGDVDYHFGLLYGAAQLSCWTFPAGENEKVIQIYGE